MSGQAIVLQGDALHLPLPDDSVDLIVTSPPYFALRSYRDAGEHYDGQIGSEDTPQQFLEALWAATAEMVRVLKPTGSIFVNLGDKHAGSGGANQSNVAPSGSRRGGAAVYNKNATFEAEREQAGVPAKSLMLLPERYRIGCVDRLGLIAREVLVWRKPNGLPESVRDRCRRSHEDWVHLTKQGDYFSAVDEIREPYNPTTNARGPNGAMAREGVSIPTWGMDGTQSLKGVDKRYVEPDPRGKLPGSVWTIPSEPLMVPAHVQVDHFAAFPTEWPRRLILGWSPSGICENCHTPIGGSGHDRETMRGVRGADHGQSHQDGVREEAGVKHQSVLWEDVREPVHGAGQEVDEVPEADDKRLRRGMAAGSSDGPEDRLPHGAPLGDGEASGQDAGSGRSRSSHQRGPDRQPNREPRTPCQDGPRSLAETSTQAVSVPSLRGPDPDVWDALTCPNCGSDRIRPSVVVDVFGGTGTVALVARALGCVGISVDLSHDYSRLARWRVFESGHARKSLARTWSERQEGFAI